MRVQTDNNLIIENLCVLDYPGLIENSEHQWWWSNWLMKLLHIPRFPNVFALLIFVMIWNEKKQTKYLFILAPFHPRIIHHELWRLYVYEQSSDSKFMTWINSACNIYFCYDFCMNPKVCVWLCGEGGCVAAAYQWAVIVYLFSIKI